jgi:DNA (cytosine-5)-methyltransferase 1
VPVLLGRRKEAWPRRSRGQLFVRFIDLMAAIRPRYAVIENVRGVLSKKLGSLPVILAKIEQAGYQVSYKLYGAGDFGVPQHRRRVVFFLSRDGETIPPMVPSHGGEGQSRHCTLRDVIGHLQGTAMEVQHLAPSLLQYMQYIPAGGNWRSIPLEHKPAWLSEKTKIGTDWFPRAAWDEPAPTLKCEVGATRRGSAHCDPDGLRALSVEECAAIQTFPPGFCLAGPRRQKYRQTGECGSGEVRPGDRGAFVGPYGEPGERGP